MVKSPDDYKGQRVVVYGEVTQFDSATGKENFLANVGSKKQRPSDGFVDYDDNSLLEGAATEFQDVVEGDVFSAKVEVLGSESYDTQLGGNTTVPKLRVHQISVYASTK